MQQNYGHSGQNPNIFSQIAAWRSRQRESLTESEVERVSNMRTDKSSADEAKLWLKAVLFAATSVTIFLSMKYYQENFAATMTKDVAAILAIVLAAAVEIGKIKLFGKFGRSVVFGWAWQSWPSLGYWGFVGALAALSYFWSFKVSTEGLQVYAAQQAETKVQRDTLPYLLATATADIDRQIASEEASRKSHESNRWKGNIVYESAKAAKQSSLAIAELQKQRSAIVQQTTDDYRQNMGKRETKINGFAAFILRFGGYMEIITGLCLLGMIFADWKLVHLAHSSGQAPEDDPDNGQRSKKEERGNNNSTATATPAPQHIPRIYNLHQDPPRASEAPTTEPVSQCDTGEATTTVVGSDEVVAIIRKRILSDVANLRNRNGQPATVYARLEKQFDMLADYFAQPNFCPSTKECSAMRDALSYAFDVVVYENNFCYRKEFYLKEAIRRFSLGIVGAYTYEQWREEEAQKIAA